MADVPPGSGSDEKSEMPSPPGLPGWIKLFGIILAVIIVAVIVMAIGGGGEHGPGRHI